MSEDTWDDIVRKRAIEIGQQFMTGDTPSARLLADRIVDLITADRMERIWPKQEGGDVRQA